MTKAELIEFLKPFPDDMSIWISDNGNSEGGTRLTIVEKVLANDAGLDGDDIDDEWICVEEDTDIQFYLDKGYQLCERGEILSKEIIYLNDEYYKTFDNN
jgi:hypothetical protein